MCQPYETELQQTFTISVINWFTHTKLLNIHLVHTSRSKWLSFFFMSFIQKHQQHAMSHGMLAVQMNTAATKSLASQCSHNILKFSCILLPTNTISKKNLTGTAFSLHSSPCEPACSTCMCSMQNQSWVLSLQQSHWSSNLQTAAQPRCSRQIFGFQVGSYATSKEFPL